MEIQIIEQTATKAELKVPGTDHTLLNMLVKQMQQDKEVIAAAYNIEHPLAAQPKLIVETTSKTSPKKALDKAVKDLKKANQDFIGAFEKQFK